MDVPRLVSKKTDGIALELDLIHAKQFAETVCEQAQKDVMM